MVVTNNRVTLGDILIYGALGPVIGLLYLVDRSIDASKAYVLRRQAEKAAAERKAKRLASKKAAPKRPARKRVSRIVTARDHRSFHGVAPAWRIINGGKA
jgi:hypothetical protein